jgi:formylglycine-generating enzyme required for sulfatase activity
MFGRNPGEVKTNRQTLPFTKRSRVGICSTERGKRRSLGWNIRREAVRQPCGFGKGQTELVGSRKPNGLGLYDMSGNVWEWVQDFGHENYNGAPTDGRPWGEESGGNCGQRVIRSGSWGNEPENLRVSYQNRYSADISGDVIGFRLAHDIE